MPRLRSEVHLQSGRRRALPLLRHADEALNRARAEGKQRNQRAYLHSCFQAKSGYYHKIQKNGFGICRTRFCFVIFMSDSSHFLYVYIFKAFRNRECIVAIYCEKIGLLIKDFNPFTFSVV